MCSLPWFTSPGVERLVGLLHKLNINTLKADKKLSTAKVNARTILEGIDQHQLPHPQDPNHGHLHFPGL